MSDDSPYRVPDTDLRPALGSYSSSARHHASPQNDFYRPHQEPPPPPSHQSSFSAYPSASSSRGTSAVTPPLSQGSMDGALGILNSCGLEPSDLSLLAELPESLLTVDSLPRLLQQLKGKRGTIKPSPHNAPSSSSSPSSSYSASVVRQPAGKWDHLHSQLVQYPLDHVASLHLPSEQVQDRWGKQTSSSVSYTPSTRSDLPPPPSSSSSSSSSSRYLVDYNNRASSSDYGKTARDAGQASSQDRGTFRSTGRSRGSRFSQADYRSVPPPEENHQRTWQGRRKAEPSPSSSSSSRVTDTKPSTKQGRDFHGMMPVVYPYSCSLCDITVLSEKVWIQHVNSTQHADRQLSLLQRFPNWDCRMETINRDEEQSQKKDEGIPAQLPQAANQNSKPQPTKKAQKKTSEKGKVACVKFPHQSVDEAYLRKLSEPFGKVVKILIFPSLAFVEMGSIDQVKDLVKFHNNYPPTVNGVQMEFSISDTFNFLQSTRVVSFSPAPAGEEGQSDLLSIVKRFGQPLYTLFLPSMAYVEMKNAADAEKLVEYYSSNTLRVNKDQIKVSFSGEYKVLMRVPSAKRYEEETCSTKSMKGPSGDQEDKKSQSKRTRSRSGDREDKTSRSKRTRSRSGEREDKTSQSKRTRSRSGEREDKTNRSKRTRSRSGDREEKTSQSNRTKSPSRDREDKTSRSNETRSSRSNGEKTRSSTDRRSRSRDKSREKSSSRSSEQNRSRENKSRSREKRSRSQEKQSRSREITVVPEKPIESKPEFKGKAELPTTACEPEEKESSELEAESSAEESDIEGMEVIGEDLENEDLESLDDDDVEEENEEEKEDSPEQDGKKEEKDAEAGDQEKKDEEEEESPSCRAAEETAESQLEDKEEPDFPLDLENCITLDEVEELNEADTEGICVAQEEEEENRDDPEGASTRVVHFNNLPLHRYTVDEFLGLVKGFGRATRYLLHSDGQQGFIEMSSCSEAQRAVTELSCQSVSLNGSKLNISISHKYSHLSSGSIVPWDMDETTERVSQNSSSKSNTSERDESGGRKESSKNTPERDSMSEKTPEKDAMSENTPERESMSEKTPEKDAMSEKTPERESMSEKTPERESASVEILKKESDTCKTAEEDLCKDKTSSEVEPVCNEETSDSGEKIPDEPDSPVDSLRAGNEEEAAAGPAEAAAAPLKPSKPVGTEYVRPVVGYFCNLCQVIYADEDEAKQQHCSSLSHYTKYQEVTGKDPWMN